MKFSKETIEILQNFSLINPSLIFKPGKTLKTMSTMKSIISTAEIGDEIPSEFAIYNLSQFLSVVALFDDPEFTILDRQMVISSGKESINYVFADSSLIISPPEKELTLPSEDVTFELSNDVLKRILKAAVTLGSPEIAVTGDRESIYIEAMNTKNSSDNSYKVKIGETSNQFKLVFSLENIKLLPRDYSVAISKQGLAQFKADGLTYFIVMEKKPSSFED